MAYRSGWPWWAASVIRINIGIYVVVSFRFISILLINCVFGLHVLDLVSNTTQYTTNDDGVDNDAPVETQSAQCTITAGDVKAQAQATISKKLEGICSTSKEQQHMATQMISLNSFFLLHFVQSNWEIHFKFSITKSWMNCGSSRRWSTKVFRRSCSIICFRQRRM